MQSEQTSPTQETSLDTQANSASFLDSYFSITQRGSTLKRELIAGLTTFLAMSTR